MVVNLGLYDIFILIIVGGGVATTPLRKIRSRKMLQRTRVKVTWPVSKVVKVENLNFCQFNWKISANPMYIEKQLKIAYNSVCVCVCVCFCFYQIQG